MEGIYLANITLKNIVKKYDENVIAVHDFNLEIKDKEFIILVGPSGCGKSTTLRMIAGLEEISDGELYIGDKLVNNVPPKDRDIAMVFQNYALYPHMSVYKNMAFGLTLRKMPKDEIDKKVNEVAKILDIEHLLERKPKQLSGGQRQRVALGRAMVRDPQVFLLDEPLSNLDAKLRTQMRTEITKLHKKLGTTFVYVTHDQIEAMTMGDRIVVMKDGFIQQVDTPQSLYSNPENLFVAGFIGSPQMNFSDVVLKKENDKYYLIFHENKLSLYVPKEKETVLDEFLEKVLIMGVRPENVSVLKNASDDECIKSKVDIAEPMGSEILVYIDCNGDKFISREYDNTEFKDSEDVFLKIDMKNIHLFDKETEKSLKWK